MCVCVWNPLVVLIENPAAARRGRDHCCLASPAARVELDAMGCDRKTSTTDAPESPNSKIYVPKSVRLSIIDFGHVVS